MSLFFLDLLSKRVETSTKDMDDNDFHPLKNKMGRSKQEKKGLRYFQRDI